MLSQQDLEYHQQRARAEMDRAYRAEHKVAAEAHMRLAGLHMERLKRQDELCHGSSNLAAAGAQRTARLTQADART
jgi:hypothetical protein